MFVPVDVVVHALVVGLYLPPVFKRLLLVVCPPQITIWVPVHMAVWFERMAGTPAPVDVVVHASVEGL